MAEQPQFKFSELKRPNSPNNYLACPMGYCPATAEQVSPSFLHPAKETFNQLAKIVKSLPRTAALYVDKEHFELGLIERSRVLGFKDNIYIKVIATGANTSTIAIYSHSNTGYYDFGVNKKRVQKLLNSLKDNLDVK